MAAMLQQPPMKVSNLDSILRNLASFKISCLDSGVEAGPPQRVAPKAAPVSTPTVPSWMKGGGYRNSDD